MIASTLPASATVSTATATATTTNGPGHPSGRCGPGLRAEVRAGLKEPGPAPAGNLVDWAHTGLPVSPVRPVRPVGPVSPDRPSAHWPSPSSRSSSPVDPVRPGRSRPVQAKVRNSGWSDPDKAIGRANI
ncbi:hypothetical protein L211DRAFT_853306 [Terfezia boudieri ATCC MYA-4762]|uniref:Uncharacterized protein n=1 Tax=Terfezia boudieri ATCC MYA-4762 TaxID=1051890 RepID=A0A3N4L8Y4_9PEZI|nr:hypothetical protein L211DRAFT_853306 [Terfezia boudieri ATCC MYA-4762]